MSLAEYRKVAVFPDLHFPFHSKRDVDEGLRLVKQEKPDLIVQIGDGWECYNFSVHNRSMLVMRPDEEIRQARACWEAFWGALDKVAPKADKLFTAGNHDWPRIEKKILDRVPEIEAVINALDVKQLWRIDGVRMIDDWKAGFDCRVEGFTLPWRFIHGWYKFGEHIKRNPGFNVCTGHLHRGGVVYTVLEDSTQTELNAGFMGDKDQLVFRYTPQKMKDWTPGMGWIDTNGARFQPFRQ